MSFQAYLDAAETKTGRTPQQLIDLAHAHGFTAETKAGEILAWLKEDFDLGRGHGMALVHVIKNGPGICDKHVGTTGAHRDESDVLRLDGRPARS
jgi:UDP-glucose 4-epimerase